MDPKRTKHEALRLAVAEGYRPHETGLRKVCPRCLREGWVFILVRPDFGKRPDALVVWDGQRRGGPSEEGADMDICVPDLLFRPNFGCGFDPTAEEQAQLLDLAVLQG